MTWLITFIQHVGTWNVDVSDIDNQFQYKKLELCDFTARKEKMELEVRKSTLNYRVSRLLFLFLIDFLDGIDLAVILNKDRRDHFFHGNPSKKVAWCWWTAIIVFDIVMLAFTIRYALSTTESVQYIWFLIIVIWFIVDVFFINTFLTLWTQVLLPSFSYSHIKRVKSAVIGHLLDAVRRRQVSTSFNAASHFFVSHRLAASLTEIESDAKNAILSFHTLWPQMEFVNQGIIPPPSSSNRFLRGIVSGSVKMSPLVCDFTAATVISLLLGIILIILGVAYQKNPVIAFSSAAGMLCLVLLIFMLGAWSKGKNDSLSLINQKWNSAMQTDSNPFAYEMSFSDRHANDYSFSETNPYASDFSLKREVRDGGKSMEVVRCELRDDDCDNQEYVLGGDEYEQVEITEADYPEMVTSDVALQDFDTEHEAMI